MHKATKLPENALGKFLAHNGETIWTGYGASYAMAATIAATVQRIARKSRVLRPNEIVERQHTAVVSQSCITSGDLPGFVVTGRNAAHKAGERSLLVDDTDIGQEWFPATFQNRALTAVGEALGIKHTNCYSCGVSAEPVCLVFDDCIDQIQWLFSAAQNKLHSLRMSAVSVDDFAHGAHALALREGEVVLVRTSPKAGEKIDLIAKWLRQRCRPVEILDINAASEELPLTLHAVALDAIVSHAKARGINIVQSCIKPEDDELRHSLAAGRSRSS